MEERRKRRRNGPAQGYLGWPSRIGNRRDVRRGRNASLPGERRRPWVRALEERWDERRYGAAAGHQSRIAFVAAVPDTLRPGLGGDRGIPCFLPCHGPRDRQRALVDAALR